MIYRYTAHSEATFSSSCELFILDRTTHLALFRNPSPETCEVGPLIAMLIPTTIIALVLVGIVGFGIYSCVTNYCKKNDGN